MGCPGTFNRWHRRTPINAEYFRHKGELIIAPWWHPGTPKAASTYGISFGAIDVGIKGSSTWAAVLQHW
jgi:hypothetical protein